MADLVERLRAYDAKASLIDRLREHDLSSYPEDGDWQDHYCDRADDLLKEAAAALEAEASEGERRGLERALEFAKYEAAAWGYEQGSSARVAAACIERAIGALIPEAPVREAE